MHFSRIRRIRLNCPASSKRLFVAIIVLLACRCAFADVLDQTKNVSGITVHYKVVLPNGYDPAKAYPAVLAFSGGPQTMATVESTVERNWRAEAERRGYIVVVPAAPAEGVYFEGGAQIFPEFLKVLLNDYKIQDNKFHIAGVSNGGISAYHIAALYPQYFISVTGFPGYLPLANEARTQRLAEFVPLPARRRTRYRLAARNGIDVRPVSRCWAKRALHSGKGAASPPGNV